MARKVRTRLETSSDSEPVTITEAGSVLDERQYGKPVRRHVLEFAQVFSIIFLILGAFRIWRHHEFFPLPTASILAGILLYLGYRRPLVLYPLWKGWMAFAHVLGTIVNTIILSLAWTLVLIPTAIVMRILGKRLLDTRFGVAVETYWETRTDESNDFELLTRQF